MFYSRDRNIWMKQVHRASKDNPAVKKGNPYIRVKKDKFSDPEFFKDTEALDKVYPIPSFREKHSHTIKMLQKYKKALKENPRLGAEKFLKDEYNN